MKKVFFVLPVVAILTGCGGSVQPGESAQENDMQDSGYVDKLLETRDNTDAIIGLAQQRDAEIARALDELNSNNKNMETTIIVPEQVNMELASCKGAILKTNKGDITVEFYGEESPVTVASFCTLADMGFYDDVIFHRIISDFMIQGGDPDGLGTGGPGYQFGDEINSQKLVRGSLAMANAGPGTNGSQFFIVTAESTPWLDGAHTNFGMVTAGMETVEAIEAAPTGAQDRPIEDIVINSIELQK